MSFEDPTQRLSVPPRDPDDVAASRTTAALPRPLNLAGPTPTSGEQPPDKTDEPSLDEIFAGSEPQPAPPASTQPATEQPAGAGQAPTWTAMPVIPVRSEPVAPAQPADRGEETGQIQTKRTGPSTGERLVLDASAAWDGALRRTQAWLTHDDNGLMLMTAVVAIILILVVAAVGS